MDANKKQAKHEYLANIKLSKQVFNLYLIEIRFLLPFKFTP